MGWDNSLAPAFALCLYVCVEFELMGMQLKETIESLWNKWWGSDWVFLFCDDS